MGEDKAVELLAKVLHHVVALRLAVHKEVKTNLLLETDDGLDLLGDKLIVLLLGEFTLGELGTGLANLLGLLEKGAMKG